jgi:hypothetical protein
MQVSIRVTGFVQALGAVRALGEAGKAVSGPFANWGSRLAYAGVIETGMRYGRPWRKAGPALMFQRGVSETLPQIPAIVLPAIPKGAASVGQAKRKVRDLGIANIRKYTPVVSGALRDSVRDLTRPA